MRMRDAWTRAWFVSISVCWSLYSYLYAPLTIVSDAHQNIALWENKSCIVGKRTFPHDGTYDAHIFPTMHFPHNVSFVRMCVFSPQRPTRKHRFSPQCTFPTMYHLYVCVYFPHNDQLGRTYFPHNALSPQCITCTYVCTFPTTTN